METMVIGIDFSTTPAKTGLARATVADGCARAVLHEAFTATPVLRPRVNTVVDWIQQVRKGMPVLIAIDAPLGWPDGMKCPPFTSHVAGCALKVDADQLFARETDRQVQDRIGQRPLEVGANRIARSAHGALRFLQKLRDGSNGRAPLPLAWSPQDLETGPCVVEVYPAATMKACCISTGNYKKQDGQTDRDNIVKQLRKRGLTFKVGADEVARNDHMVDAAVCVLAGWDFLAGQAIGPDDNTRPMAEREGWIWARKRLTGSP